MVGITYLSKSIHNIYNLFLFADVTSFPGQYEAFSWLIVYAII